MHVSPAKYSYASVTDGQTDRRTKWSLCVAMLRRRHKNEHFSLPTWNKIRKTNTPSWFVYFFCNDCITMGNWVRWICTNEMYNNETSHGVRWWVCCVSWGNVSCCIDWAAALVVGHVVFTSVAVVLVWPVKAVHCKREILFDLKIQYKHNCNDNLKLFQNWHQGLWRLSTMNSVSFSTCTFECMEYC